MNRRDQLILILLFLFLFFGLSAVWAEEKKEANTLEFHFALVYKSSEDQIKAINIKPYVELKAGTQIKIFINPLNNAYIYLFHYDTEKQLSLLFPDSMDYYNRFIPMEMNYFLPGEKMWYILDDKKGTEYFYLLASTKRLLTLESLTYTYLNYSRKGTSLEIQQAGEAILNKILEIRKTISGLALPAEIPITIVGNVKDDYTEEDRIIDLGIKIIAERLYGKTIRIVH